MQKRIEEHVAKLKALDVGESKLKEILKNDVIRSYEKREFTHYSDAQRLIKAIQSNRKDAMTRFEKVYNRLMSEKGERRKNKERKEHIKQVNLFNNSNRNIDVNVRNVNRRIIAKRKTALNHVTQIKIKHIEGKPITYKTAMDQQSRLKDLLKKLKGMKMQVVVTYDLINRTTRAITSKFKHSSQLTVLSEEDIAKRLNEAKKEIFNFIENYDEENYNDAFHGIKSIEIKIAKYAPLRGSSYYSTTPKDIKH